MSQGRTYMSLNDLVRTVSAQSSDSYWKKDDPRRYEGLEECRKNVIKCGCFKKLKYCVRR